MNESINKLEILSEIKGFLDGYNQDLKYLVNVETNPSTNFAECIIHEPGESPKIIKVGYEPFMYMKDLQKNGAFLYNGYSQQFIDSMKIKYGIKIHTLKTGNQKRLVDGYCYKITSKYSFNAIINFLKDGGINPYDKSFDEEGHVLRDKKGDIIYKYRDLFFSVKTTEQFLISTRSRLFKGYEEYKDIHKLTFDIETTGLRYQIARVFAIGVRDNRGFETILEVDKENDDESEIKLIQDFFNLIQIIKPAIIAGYNSEVFDFEFILGRAKILKMDLESIPTTLSETAQLKRIPNSTFKHGSNAEKYTSTQMWGISVIDILHAAKKTAAVNSDIKEVKLKYLAKYEKVAKSNRTYISGEDNAIGRMYHENKIFVIDKNNEYLQVPSEFQEISRKVYTLQANKNKINDEQYQQLRKEYFGNSPEFVDWLKKEAIPKGMINFIGGKNLVKQYLLDDLYETEQIDGLYNQSSFMLAKIVPTTYTRVCTMGTAAIWNLLMTAWSYENDLAIPHTDVNERFSGGLARCFKTGYSKRIVKIDYASLYPMIQLTWNVFPMFDITGVIKKMLLYLTTTRNIYKKLANGDKLNNEEITLLKEVDHTVYDKYINNTITSEDKALFKIKQLPIKILNNSMFGALGSGISFNWSDNVCAARITCCGRLYLRCAVSWFSKFNCVPLLAVTDGINFSIPDTTTIKVTDEGIIWDAPEGKIEDMWQYNGKNGIAALIDKFNNDLKNDTESVTYDSPIYVLDKNNEIDIKPICELFNENSNNLDEKKERDFEIKDYKVLTKTGWSKINYVFKHKTNKKIYRLETKDRLINITEDHSVFQNGKEIKPLNLNRNDEIDVINIPEFNSNDNIDIELAWLYGFFFGDGHSTYRKRYKLKNNVSVKYGNRKVWKISNTNLDYLNKCVDIFYREYNIKLDIIDRSKSQKKSNNKLPLFEIVSFNDKISSFYTNEFYTSYGEKKIPKSILNGNDNIKRMFIYGALASDGYYLSLFDVDSLGQKSLIGMAGLSYLLNSLKVEYSISTRKDKENFITFRFNTIKNKKFLNEIVLNRKTNLIWNNRLLNKYENSYVYDISTEDETFVSGIGGILCHNTSAKQNYLMVDNDGESISCLNLSRINYATLSLAKDKKTGEMKEKVKLTGNTIKSKTMPEYIEEFIDKGLIMILNGKGKEFVDYYYDYVDDIRYMQIPLKKIASKSKIKISLDAYRKRGKDKNGREKGMQAHMELLLQKRNEIVEELFQKYKDSLIYTKKDEKLTIDDKLKLVMNYMPQEPELDSMVYYVNCGYKKSHGDSRLIVDKITGKERFCAKLISNEDLQNNPNIIGEYNYEKYLDAFNKRVETLLMGFDVDVRKKILVKLDKKTGELKKEMFLNDQLVLKNFEDDTFDESMHMEKMEVLFWNKTGYDPRLVWNGFKTYDDYEHTIYYEIYDNALNHLNDLMKKNNKPLIKSINDNYISGDLVLIKDGSKYHIGAYNGTYLQIVRNDVAVPKSQIELELDKIREEEEKKLQNLTLGELQEISNKDLYLEDEEKFKAKMFYLFKENYHIPVDATMENVFSTIENSKEVFEDFYQKHVEEINVIINNDDNFGENEEEDEAD